MTSTSTKQRLVHFDMMVGLAMTLVVLGHFSVGVEPKWYADGLHHWIYSFHMELFVFLSAFLIRYTYKEVQSPLEYGKYIWRKFKKFFVWFLIIGMAVAIIAPFFRHAPLSVDYLWQSLRTLLLYPRWSETAFLWYIYILFGYYLISPLFFRLPQLVQVLCCIGALFLAMIDSGTFLCANEFCQYTFFYCLGVLCAQWIDDIRNAKRWLWALLSLPFVAYSIWISTEGYAIGFGIRQLGWWTTVTGVASLPFFYLLSMALQKIGPVRKTLTAISKDCYIIYLLQMFIIWGSCWLLQQAGILEKTPFGVLLVGGTILAIALPIGLATIYRRIRTNTNKKSGTPLKSSR